MKWWISYLIFWFTGIRGYIVTKDENYMGLLVGMTVIIGFGWLLHYVFTNTWGEL